MTRNSSHISVAFSLNWSRFLSSPLLPLSLCLNGSNTESVGLQKWIIVTVWEKLDFETVREHVSLTHIKVFHVELR